MYELIIVVSLVAVVTFITGLVLPLASRGSRTPDGMSPEERDAAELAAGL
jgi:hypothetical protein